MKKHIYIHKVFKALTLLIVCLVLHVSCAKDPFLVNPGKPVKVSLSFSVSSLRPPSTAVLTDTSIVAKSTANKSVNDKFNVSLEETFTENSRQQGFETRAKVSASLYNLWVLQFGTDKKLVKASKMPNTPEPVKEMITIDADLVVGTDQTIYLVCLGAQYGDVDLSLIKNITDLESYPLQSIRYVDGVAQSVIQQDKDIPYVGFCEGVDIVLLESDGRGYVKYDSSTGFVGGISMRAMISKVSFNFSYKVADLTPSMMTLNNVPTSFCINPTADYKPNSFVSLPAISFEDVSFEDGERYETSWYVAPNRQGDVSTITRQEDRYFYYLSGSATGTAPKDGTYINIWASDNNLTGNYALYYIFLGSNTSSDFNVHPQTHYILRSDINTAPSENDNRVIFSKLEQKIDFNVSGYHLNTVKPSRSGEEYNLDASAGCRPIEISCLRGIVKVEVLTSGNDDNPVPVSDSWMQLSTSSNYTDALNRKNGGDQDALTTSIEIKTDIPGLIKLYLYHDENINYTTNNPSKKDSRRLYVRFTFSSTNSSDEVFTYYMDQQCAFYLGQIGGKQDASTGIYSHGLVMSDKFNKCGESYLSYHIPNKTVLIDQIKVLKAGSYPAVTSYEQAVTEFGIDNREDGMMSTMLYAENRSGYQTINTTSAPAAKIPAPRRINGKLDLYQYQGKYNTGEGFAARWCYDKNRDKNGNGEIDYLPNDPINNEMVWYLPSINQLRNFGLNFHGTNYSSVCRLLSGHYLLSSTAYALNYPYSIRVYTPRVIVENAYEVRCVRDVSLPVKLVSENEPVFSAPKVEVVDGYAVIDASGLVTGSSIYKKKGDLYIDNNERNRRHVDFQHSLPTIGTVTSSRFRVAPHNIDSLGVKTTLITDEGKMTWSQASGFNYATNKLAITISPGTADTGCPMYNETNPDPNLGKWRLPTLNEMILIEMMEQKLISTSGETGFTPLSFISTNGTQGISSYWTATEYNEDNGLDRAWVITEDYNRTLGGVINKNKRSPTFVQKEFFNFVRCVQDLPY